MLLHRDLARLEKGLLDLYAPGLGMENYPERAFHLFGQFVSYESIGLIVRDTANESINVHLDQPLPGLAKVAVPFGELAPRYPWFRADPAIHGGRPHCRSDFCSDRQFRDLDIHSEIFRHWGHQHFMSMYLHTEKSRVVFFGFNRGRGDFSMRERSLAALAGPHLSAARHLALALQVGKSRPLTPDLIAGWDFTPRESEVLYWLTEGKSNVEIATILHIGLPTVKGYLTAIFNKTGVGNRHAAILYVLDLAKRMNPTLLESPLSNSSIHVPYRVPPLPK